MIADCAFLHRMIKAGHLIRCQSADTKQMIDRIGIFACQELAARIRPQILVSTGYVCRAWRNQCYEHVLINGQLVLDWSAVPYTAGYWVYGADNAPYFEPGLVSPYQYRLTTLLPGTTTWSGSNGIGDPDHNWTYLVIAVGAGDQVLGSSNRFGEHDFDVSSP